MARLELAIQTVTRAGVNIGSGQAVLLADGAQLANDGKTILKLANTTGAPIVVTFQTPQTILGAPSLAVADQTFSVPATSDRWIGPFPGTAFNNASNKLLIDVAADGVNMTAVAIGE